MDKGHLHVAEILVKSGAHVNYRNKVRVLITAVTQVRMSTMNSTCCMLVTHTLYIPLVHHNTISINGHIVVSTFDTNKIPSLCVLVIDFD